MASQPDALITDILVLQPVGDLVNEGGCSCVLLRDEREVELAQVVD